MLEITIDNCYKCDLETIIDPNNSQYFWINRRDLEIESKRSWQAIFDKCNDSLRQKYRKELKDKLGLCPYEVICDEREFSTSKEIFKEENIFTHHDDENKELKEENKQLKEQLTIKKRK